MKRTKIVLVIVSLCAMAARADDDGVIRRIPNGTFADWTTATGGRLEREFKFTFSGPAVDGFGADEIGGDVLALHIRDALKVATNNNALWQAPALANPGANPPRKYFYQFNRAQEPTETCFFDLYFDTANTLNFNNDVSYRLRQRFDTTPDFESYLANGPGRPTRVESFSKINRTTTGQPGQATVFESRNNHITTLGAAAIGTLVHQVQTGRVSSTSLPMSSAKGIAQFYLVAQNPPNPPRFPQGTTFEFDPLLFLAIERHRQHLALPISDLTLRQNCPGLGTNETFIVSLDVGLVFEAECMLRFLRGQTANMPPHSGCFMEVEVEFERNVSDPIDACADSTTLPANIRTLFQNLRTALLADQQTVMNVITNKIFQVDAGRKIIAIGPRAESKYTQAVQMLDNPTFIRGDANGDGVVDISDPTTILNHLFEGQCSCTNGACDSNDDGNVDITDAIYLLTFLFSGGPPPPPPFPLAGKDPTPNP